MFEYDKVFNTGIAANTSSNVKGSCELMCLSVEIVTLELPRKPLVMGPKTLEHLFIVKMGHRPSQA